MHSNHTTNAPRTQYVQSKGSPAASTEGESEYGQSSPSRQAGFAVQATYSRASNGLEPSQNPNRAGLSRRAFVGLAFGGASLALLNLKPVAAFADTQSDLEDAQRRYDEAQQELEQIGTEYETVSQQLSDTLDQIYDVQNNIDSLTSQIDQKEESLEYKRDKLSKSVRDSYKNGDVGALDLILGSKSIDDLVSNIYYYDRITNNTAELIQSINDEKSELEVARASLEDQKAELETAQQQQEEQLSQMQAKQQEAQDLVESLDQEVKDLIAQRDAELLAAQQEAERAEQERQAAAAAAAAAAEAAARNAASAASAAAASAASASTSTGSAGRGGNGTGSAAAVVAACGSTPSPGAGLCAMWVTQVFQNAGVCSVGGNACDMYNNWCYSSNRSDLKPGMVVAVSTHSHTVAGGIYGHVGIYIGGGLVMQNVGWIDTMSIDSWCSWYGTTVSPRWGWLGGVTLS